MNFFNKNGSCMLSYILLPYILTLTDNLLSHYDLHTNNLCANSLDEYIVNKNEIYATAVEVRILAAMITKYAKQELEQHLDEASAGISGIQYGILRILRFQEHTLSELSRQMMLDPSTLVPVIDSLERKCLVKRGKDPKDRRRTPIGLTEHGAELLERVPFLDNDSILVKSLNLMSEEQRQHLLLSLRELVTNLIGSEEAIREITAAASATAVLKPSYNIEKGNKQ